MHKISGSDRQQSPDPAGKNHRIRTLTTTVQFILCDNVTTTVSTLEKSMSLVDKTFWSEIIGKLQDSIF